MTALVLRGLLLLTLAHSALVAVAIRLERGSPPADLLAYSTLNGDEQALHVLDARRGVSAALDPAYPPAVQDSFGWSAAGHLVFASERDGHSDIYLTDLVTYINLSQHPAEDFRPSITPAGEVFFVSDRGGSTDIYRWAAGELTNVSQTPGSDTEPFSSARGQVGWLYDAWTILVYDDERVRPLTDSSYRLVGLTWSQDGRIAGCVFRDGDCELTIWQATTGAALRIHTSRLFSTPAWSRDGRLAYPTEIGVYVWDGQHSRQVIPLRYPIKNLAWADDDLLTFSMPRANLTDFPTGIYGWDGRRLRLLVDQPHISNHAWIPAP
jgi:Tol biopolymer transport system component